MGIGSPWQLLREPQFRTIWAAQTCSTFGDAMFRVAQVVLVLQLGGTAFGLSGVILVSIIPGILFSLIGGVWADRIERRRLLIAVNASQAILMLLLTTLHTAGQLELWQLYVFAILFGSLSALANPAYNAILPNLISSEKLQQGNALFSIGDSFGYIAGPALAGGLIALVGIGGLSLLNGCSFAFMAFALLSLRANTPAIGHTNQPSSFWHDLREGWQTVVGNPTLVLLLGLFAVINIATPVMGIALPLYVQKTLKAGTDVYGYLLAAMNGGILFASLALTRVQITRVGLAIPLSVACIGLLGYVGLSITHVAMLAAVLLAISDGLTMVPNILFPSWLQRTTPAELQGRVFSLVGVMSYALVPIGYVLAGWSVTALEPTGALSLAGWLLAGIAGLAFLVPSFRTIRFTNPTTAHPVTTQPSIAQSTVHEVI